MNRCEEEAENALLEDVPMHIIEATRKYNDLLFKRIYSMGWKKAVEEAIKICNGNAEANAQVKPEFESGCRSSGRIIKQRLL